MIKALLVRSISFCSDWPCWVQFWAKLVCCRLQASVCMLLLNRMPCQTECLRIDLLLAQLSSMPAQVVHQSHQVEFILPVAGLPPLTVTEAYQQLMTALLDSHDLDGKCDRVRELMGHIRTRKQEMSRSVCNLHVLFCTVRLCVASVRTKSSCLQRQLRHQV